MAVDDGSRWKLATKGERGRPCLGGGPAHPEDNGTVGEVGGGRTATNRCSSERCRRRGGRRGRGRFSASLLDSVHGEVAEVEAELVEATAGLGVAGVDGEERGTAAARRRSGACRGS